MRLIVSLLALAACTPSSTEDGLSGGDTGDTGSGDSGAGDSGSGDSGSGDSGSSADEPVYSEGACPVLTEGRNTGFVSAGYEREFRVLLPANPEGAKTVFAWHWLGGSARDIVTYMGLQDWADDRGFIVIAPDSRDDEPYEWAFSGRANNPDAVFFDDLVACARATWGIDLDDIHAMGMSAGGLWTTWLTVYRSETLASTAPLSGGTTVYIAPEAPIPVLLTWGGPTDTYSGFSFDDASQVFSAGLQADGHFVVECVHDGGHTIPAAAPDYLGQWFSDHRRGQDPDPYASGLPGVFPDWCSIP